jgi:YjbE family integral membrane protein
MDLFSPEFFSALLAIVIIDLVLAGDNAIVIALAARKLPPHLQMKAVVWGTAGAIGVRVAMTVIVVALLRIPWLMLVGGVLLVWIAYRLLASDDSGESDASGPKVVGFWSAIRTIIVADAVMGLDNVLGVAGAAKGSFLLVLLGLLISIPIMVWGSTLILRIVDRYPLIVYLGAAVLAWTAAGMILHEPWVKERLVELAWVRWLVYFIVTGGVLLVGWLHNRRTQRTAVVLPERAGTHTPPEGAEPAPESAPRGQNAREPL